MDAADPAEQPTRRVIDQRVRNNVIEYLRWASSFDEQRKYQEEAPYVSVVGEVFEQWGDWIPTPVTRENLSDVYSSDEVRAMAAYDAVLERAIAATPDAWQPMALFQSLPIWEELRQAAEDALAVFQSRGRLPEDHEV